MIELLSTRGVALVMTEWSHNHYEAADSSIGATSENTAMWASIIQTHLLAV